MRVNDARSPDRELGRSPRPQSASAMQQQDEVNQWFAELPCGSRERLECRFFGGTSIEETADVLAVSPTRIKRDRTLAGAWLHRGLSE